MIEVLQPGIYSTIQDAGRRGFEAYGVPTSGHFDPFLAAVANRLVGNSLNEPVLEFAMIGPNLKFSEACTAAVTGFGCEYSLNGKAVNALAGFFIESGSTLSFRHMRGWFGYLAISGGFPGERILGSRSTYPAAKIGDRLRKGQTLQQSQKEFASSVELLDHKFVYQQDDPLQILPAIHTSLFEKAVQRKFVQTNFAISPQSNRMGIRLNAQDITPPKVTRSVPSLPGTIQMTHSGEAIILGPDGPTTGGYPQIGILTRTSWTSLACHPPGQSIRFEWTSIEKSREQWTQRNQMFEMNELWKPIR